MSILVLVVYLIEHGRLHVQAGRRIEMRRIRVPQHRLTQLKKNWKNIMNAIVNQMRLQVSRRTCMWDRGRVSTSEIAGDLCIEFPVTNLATRADSC